MPGDKGRFKPFTDFRIINKGKNKGRVEIVLPARPERRIIVDREAIKSFPVQEVKTDD